MPRPDLRLAWALLVVAVLTLMTSAPARAQEPASRIVDVDVARHPDVVLTIELPPGAGTGEWAVSVTEAGIARHGTLVRGERGRNEVVLVVDTSGSMAGAPMAAAKTAADAFVSQLPEQTAVAVVGFGDRPYLVSGLTTDVGALRGAVGSLQPSGETAMYDALALAVDQFSPGDVPRSIILVSDGGDTVSTTPLDAVMGELASERVRVFGVRLATDESNVAVLDQLASSTGGTAVDASADAASLTSTYDAIASSALSRLRVSYRSSASGVVPVAVELRQGDTTHRLSTDVHLPSASAPITTAPAAPATAGDDEEPAGREHSTIALAVGAGALFAATAFLLQLALVRRPRSLLAQDRRAAPRRSLREVKQSLGARLEHQLEAKGRRQALDHRLEQAGLAMRPGEYVVMVSSASAFTGLCGALVGGVPLALVFGTMAVATAFALLSMRASRRRSAAAEQLTTMLQQLTSSLRAGYGVMQSLDAIGRELGGPLAEEIRRVVAEVQLGRDLGESLHALADRIGGDDFAWVVQAIEINREVGGDLVEVIESVADTIRAREQLQRQLKTLSAEGRLSARILLAMPFVMAGVISVMSPGYLTPLASGAGPFVLTLGAALMTIGWLWLRKIVRIEY